MVTFWNIEVHLPLSCPFRKFVQICLKDVIWSLEVLIYLYRMESLAKSLMFELNESVVSFIYSNVRDRDVEHQTQHTDDVRLFIGIIDTYTWCNNQ